MLASSRPSVGASSFAGTSRATLGSSSPVCSGGTGRTAATRNKARRAESAASTDATPNETSRIVQP